MSLPVFRKGALLLFARQARDIDHPRHGRRYPSSIVSLRQGDTSLTFTAIDVSALRRYPADYPLKNCPNY